MQNKKYPSRQTNTFDKALQPPSNIQSTFNSQGGNSSFRQLQTTKSRDQ